MTQKSAAEIMIAEKEVMNRLNYVLTFSICDVSLYGNSYRKEKETMDYILRGIGTVEDCFISPEDILEKE